VVAALICECGSWWSQPTQRPTGNAALAWGTDARAEAAFTGDDHDDNTGLAAGPGSLPSAGRLPGDNLDGYSATATAGVPVIKS
jgi:hypothetical protein